MSTLTDHLRHSGRDLSELAREAGINEQRLNELLAGSDPTLQELRKLASGLGIAPTALARPYDFENSPSMLFRRSSRPLEAKHFPAVERLSTQIAQSSSLVAGTASTRWSPPDDVGGGGGPEDLAERFRDRFLNGDQVGPLLSLPRIVSDSLGIALFVSSGLRFDGASALVNGVPYIFVSPRFPPRMLFTLAHELAHLLTHHSSTEFAVFDPENSTGHSNQHTHSMERDADAFASCLLLPRAGVGVSLGAIRRLTGAMASQIGDVELLLLARIYGVSFQVAAFRCEGLSLLPRGGAASLYENLRREYGSPEKRAEELGLPPRPEVDFPWVSARLLSSVLDRVRRGTMSVGAAASALNTTVAGLVRANRTYSH